MLEMKIVLVQLCRCHLFLRKASRARVAGRLVEVTRNYQNLMLCSLCCKMLEWLA